MLKPISMNSIQHINSVLSLPIIIIFNNQHSNFHYFFGVFKSNYRIRKNSKQCSFVEVGSSTEVDEYTNQAILLD